MYEPLHTIDGETILETHFPSPSFCVETLLPEGVVLLGGAPKVGKSWFVLDLCSHVARGEPFLDLPVKRGTTLYLCLEDSLARIQARIATMEGDSPKNAFYATFAKTLSTGLCDQLRDFYLGHPDTVLIVVDTFQMIRRTSTEMSYSTDYAELQPLKELAAQLHICILLVHHLRKMGDPDPLNRFSGTTGLVGAADAALVLDRDGRTQSNARLFCSGRDIQTRELSLRFLESNCTWQVLSDSLEHPEALLPEELGDLLRFMQQIRSFSGSNSDLAGAYNAFSQRQLSPHQLKYRMTRYRYKLEELGVSFEDRRTSTIRTVTVSYAVPEAAHSAGDEDTHGSQSTDDSDPAVSVHIVGRSDGPNDSDTADPSMESASSASQDICFPDPAVPA